MDEQTKTLLKDYLIKLLTALEKGAEWTAEQIPLVIQEKLAFDFWWAVVWFVIGLVPLLPALYFARQSWSATDDDEPYILLNVFAGAVGMIICGTNLYTILKITLAPRLYIIEWLRMMI